MRKQNFAARVDTVADIMAHASDDALILAVAMRALLRAPIRPEASEAWIAALAAARNLQTVRQWYVGHLSEKVGQSARIEKCQP